MEMYLTSRKGRINFPYVPPFTVNKSYNIETFNSVNGKEFSSYGGTKLEDISFTVEFPNSERSYSNEMNGWNVIGRLQALITEQETLRFTITETTINFDVFITDMNYSVSDSSQDLILTLNLKRVLEPQVLPWSPQSQPVNKNKVQIGGLGFEDKLGGNNIKK